MERDWQVPSDTLPDGTKLPLPLKCSFLPKINQSINLSVEVPFDVEEFWSVYDSARLFEDVLYGQWGLILLSSERAEILSKKMVIERPSDFKQKDLIIGEFLGDSDVVIIPCDPQDSDYGKVIIGLPIDKRIDWPVVANSFSDFLQQYLEYPGKKFWE